MSDVTLRYKLQEETERPRLFRKSYGGLQVTVDDPSSEGVRMLTPDGFNWPIALLYRKGNPAVTIIGDNLDSATDVKSKLEKSTGVVLVGVKDGR